MSDYEFEFNDSPFTPIDPDNITEKETRIRYIDEALKRSGWTIGQDCLTEYPVIGMSNQSGEGFLDYLLTVDTVPMAIIEAKRTSVDPHVGLEQARKYAELIEKTKHVKPVIFITNGCITYLFDNIYPGRKVSGFYSADDLKRLDDKYRHRDVDLTTVRPPWYIKERIYQVRAFKKVLSTFTNRGRKALLVMATGSGKTRVAVSICAAMLDMHWAKRILFLTDREQLIRQASDDFQEYTSESLSEIYGKNSDKNFDARILISCYPSMMTSIDVQKIDGHDRFTPGYFDLIIIDEAHRSIYDTYKSIIDHFDAPVLGLTATPKNEIDRNTFDFFDITDGKPTFEYTLQEGIDAGVLVPPKIYAPVTAILKNGAEYDKLSPEDQKRYRDAFTDLDGNYPQYKDPDEFHKNIVNENTIKIVFEQLFSRGQYVNYGATLGKTIIFVPKHKYATMVMEVFNKFFKSYLNANDKFC